MSITVSRADFQATVQDLGRIGFRRFGVSLGGALDLQALRVANLLVGNEPSLAGIELAFGGLRLHFQDERVIAWCGGEFDVQVGSLSLPAGHACLICAGDELRIARAKLGCRAWVAVSGGIDVPFVLESRSTDLRAGFGGFKGRSLRAADVIPLGKCSELTQNLMKKLTQERIGRWCPVRAWSNPAKAQPVLRLVRGGDWERFNSSTLGRITSERFTVSPDSDRMGVRFESPALNAAGNGEQESEAVAPGTIQVPPGGKAILLLGDCQTVGGYPKIAHVITLDLPIAAQLRPADQVRFCEISLAEAHALLVERVRELEQFRCGLKMQCR